jgi:hypothetical protein
VCTQRESSPKPFCSEFGDEHEPETPHMKTPMVTYLPPNTRKRDILMDLLSSTNAAVGMNTVDAEFH